MTEKERAKSPTGRHDNNTAFLRVSASAAQARYVDATRANPPSGTIISSKLSPSRKPGSRRRLSTFSIDGRRVIDVEGAARPDFYYLVGLRYLKQGSPVERSIWADGPGDEFGMWRECLSILKKSTEHG